MEARIRFAAILFAALLSLGANYRTENFVVTAPDQQMAKQVCLAAEGFRKQHAQEWLGRELPPWSQPCPILVKVGGGAGGFTQFAFNRGVPFNWTMEIQGSRERILDSVLPHEVLHTIFATHFGRPLPRWADEGACTTVEHESEKNKNTKLLYECLTTDRGIAFNRMFAMDEYPADVLPLYAQGYSLARYLIVQGGKPKYVEYIGEGMRTNNWTRTTHKFYGYRSLSDLQVAWLDWVRDGSQLANVRGPQQPEQVAMNDNQPLVRGQSPDGPVATPASYAMTPLAGDKSSSVMQVSANSGDGFYHSGGKDSAPQDAVMNVAADEAARQIGSQPSSIAPTEPSPPSKEKVLLEWERTSRNAPTYYLPGGTSLFR
ncbi:hypothetical protein LOC68_25315 [Blastopirellula sp. JC732]|uniref:Peptidase MA-like domain-containing protein n=1 Tax=Blastopirellula sediminis TaxID=2894196 RepID=A0A9X1MUA4_9BACT|nr:hypothetical protein [Blastopirellula sediminis]MCC9604971.1 hypothetical protein [Blastopirellula sediminis]MCC9631729.1 hypothetical protein [Blastopirellula sediminis]